MKVLLALVLSAFALFCGYGFLASGELSGSEEMLWRSGYAVLGLGSLVVAVRLLLSHSNPADEG